MLNLGGGFSARPEVRKVEQKFGLAGMARMVKLLELLEQSPARDVGVVELALSDWQEALQQGSTLLMPFLVYLAQAGWLSFEQLESSGTSPLRVTITNHRQYLFASPLYVDPAQWQGWFAAELSTPEAVTGAAETLILFKRWCATNVTTTEVEAAIELAIQARQAPTPGVLHEHLKTVRKLKIEQALS